MGNMNLYEINQALMDFEFEIDEETGEVLNMDALDALEMARDTKIENIACYIKNLNVFVRDVKEEENALKERRAAAEKKAERLKNYLSSVLNGEKFTTAKCALTFRSSSAVEITDAAELAKWLKDNGHDSCLTYKEPTISKSAVCELIKSGVDVPCASIETHSNLQIK